MTANLHALSFFLLRKTSGILFFGPTFANLHGKKKFLQKNMNHGSPLFPTMLSLMLQFLVLQGFGRVHQVSSEASVQSWGGLPSQRQGVPGGQRESAATGQQRPQKQVTSSGGCLLYFARQCDFL